MKVSKAVLLAALDDIRERVASGDSFEGSLNYSCMEEGLLPDEFEFVGSYRINNKYGQGGMRIFSKDDPTKGT